MSLHQHRLAPRLVQRSAPGLDCKVAAPLRGTVRLVGGRLDRHGDFAGSGEEPSNADRLAQLADEELLRLISERDVDAFEALYHRHAGPVTGMLMRRLRNRELADELCQDIFAQLWQGAVGYQSSRGRFTTWLFTIVRNRCIDAARKSGRGPRSEELPGDLRDEALPDPETATYAAECRRRLLTALGSLAEGQRQAVELCIVRGFTHVEAAERLGEPLGTVKSRVKLGLQKLRVGMTRALWVPAWVV